MKNWLLQYLPEVQQDLKQLDRSVLPEIIKGIRKVAQNPEYPNGYGKPMGHHAGSNLSGLYKIKFKKSGLRVVYALEKHEDRMTVIIISARADSMVYLEAAQRREKHGL